MESTLFRRNEFSGERATSREKINRKLGEIAISREMLGINDPLSHLYRYLSDGANAIIGIKEDLRTDIAERLPKAVFLNKVDFNYHDGDFVSAKDKMSMKDMTETNLKILTQESKKRPELLREKNRAELEVDEIHILESWFKNAAIGSYLVFESLPIGNQTIAVPRIYQKNGHNELSGSFISLHNPNIATFNKLRCSMGVFSDCRSEEDFLLNYYEIQPDVDFIEGYVNAYDAIVGSDSDDGTMRYFGLKKGEYNNNQEKVDKCQRLLNPYIDLIELLGECDGRANKAIIDFCNKLNLGINLAKNQTITSDLARKILKSALNATVSAYDRLSDTELAEMTFDTGYDAVADYGSEARSVGAVYESSSCPEYNSSYVTEFTDGNSANESLLLFGFFNIFEPLKDFGKPKYDFCRIKGCPNHNRITTVGGCEICVECHKMFADGKSPDKHYEEERKKAEEKTKREELERKKKLELKNAKP